MSIHASLYAQQANTAIKKKRYTLNLLVQDTSFDQALQERLAGVFFNVYPKLVRKFNKNSRTEVTITIDTAYKGVAYAHNGSVVISRNWLIKVPEDIDVVTHEVMHIVQAYPPGSGPGWLVEGIADYVRYKYGVNNEKANWALPDLQNGQHYTDSYRVSARFLDWVERTRKKGMVKLLDRSLRSRTYSGEIWKLNTGYTLDELWDLYRKAT